MSRALALTQRQVKALCEGAKKAGYAPIVQIGNVLVFSTAPFTKSALAND